MQVFSEMLLEHQMSISKCFLKDHVTEDWGGGVFLKVNIKTVILNCNNIL